MSGDYHEEQAAKAREIYMSSLDADEARRAWHRALRRARDKVGDALRASDHLRDVAQALTDSGKHMLVFRHLMAPPMSQDQFKLLAPEWPKGTEKSGSRLQHHVAESISERLSEWFDPGLMGWANTGQRPSLREIRQIYERASSLIAMGRVATERRNLLAEEQEGAVIELLISNGWTKLSSTTVSESSALPIRHFMHKTQFATTTRPQEVDIACGLGDSFILAMECKVTNDETNSVKRINDVLKKATAWKDRWGTFVQTAAVLQGVIKFGDVERLLEAGVLVFWSHDLNVFENWLATRVPTV